MRLGYGDSGRKPPVLELRRTIGLVEPASGASRPGNIAHPLIGTRKWRCSVRSAAREMLRWWKRLLRFGLGEDGLERGEWFVDDTHDWCARHLAAQGWWGRGGSATRGRRIGERFGASADRESLLLPC
jgi:hypothetical protein